MGSSLHPAHRYEIDALIAGLDDAITAGTVNENRAGTLSLFHYSSRCVYDKLWNEFSLLARGLIIDRGARRLVATPFPKFFNYGEQGYQLPDEPFEVFEKIDGSLGICFLHDGTWQITTKGAFAQGQATWAAARLAQLATGVLVAGTTYLFEIIYRQNRIVVHYPYEDLVLLGAYHADGTELRSDEVLAVAHALGCRAASRHAYASIGELTTAAETLDRNNEGFVVRFDGGKRIKIKGVAYRRIHALITNVTPLGLWEVLEAGDELEPIRREIPEEFWADFDQIAALLRARWQLLCDEVEAAALPFAAATDKEVGLVLATIPAHVRPFIFARRKHGTAWTTDARARGSLFRSIRPTANQLPGYQPSLPLLGFTESEL